jgi:hypothetical protein
MKFQAKPYARISADFVQWATYKDGVVVGFGPKAAMEKFAEQCNRNGGLRGAGTKRLDA